MNNETYTRPPSLPAADLYCTVLHTRDRTALQGEHSMGVTAAHTIHTQKQPGSCSNKGIHLTAGGWPSRHSAADFWIPWGQLKLPAVDMPCKHRPETQESAQRSDTPSTWYSTGCCTANVVKFGAVQYTCASLRCRLRHWALLPTVAGNQSNNKHVQPSRGPGLEK